jgi:hypothetical protein
MTISSTSRRWVCAAISGVTICAASAGSAATIEIDFTGTFVQTLTAAFGTVESDVFATPFAGGLTAGDTISGTVSIDAASPPVPQPSGTRYNGLTGTAEIDGATVTVDSPSNIRIGNDTSSGRDFATVSMFANGSVGALAVQSISLDLIDLTETAISDEALSASNLTAFAMPTGSVFFRNPDNGVAGGFEPATFGFFGWFEVTDYAVQLNDGSGNVDPTPAPVPLPAGFPLLAAGLGALWALRRSRTV